MNQWGMNESMESDPIDSLPLILMVQHLLHRSFHSQSKNKLISADT